MHVLEKLIVFRGLNGGNIKENTNGLDNFQEIYSNNHKQKSADNL